MIVRASSGWLSRMARYSRMIGRTRRIARSNCSGRCRRRSDRRSYQSGSSSLRTSMARSIISGETWSRPRPRPWRSRKSPRRRLRSLGGSPSRRSSNGRGRTLLPKASRSRDPARRRRWGRRGGRASVSSFLSASSRGGAARSSSARGPARASGFEVLCDSAAF